LPSNCTIFASNISPKATESSLREFFGICGVIKKISLDQTQEGEKSTQTAIIVFETDEAAKTAIFLNDTFIIDSAIQVVPYQGEFSSDSQQPIQEIQPPAKPSVFVNALASTYMFGANLWQKAIQFDKQHQITATIQQKAKQVDESLGLSQKTKVVGEKISQVAENVDKSLKITENTNKLAEKSSNSFNALKHRNERTEKFFSNLDVLGKKISNNFEEAKKVAHQKVELVRAEIKRREEEEKANNPLELEEMSNEKTFLLSDTDNNNNNSNSNENNHPVESN